MTESVPTFWPAMSRCEQCGQFMKRGLMNWADHLEVCRGKSKYRPPVKQYQPRQIFMTQAGIKALEEASEAYFENRE